MRVLDLFSGIGGFSLGLERAGMTTVAFCEVDPYCRAVLAKHWPGVPAYEDVQDLTAERLGADGIAADFISAGFPCQDASTANTEGQGTDGERTGLFREVVRLARDLQCAALLENVTGLFGRGFGDVLGALANIGFNAEWEVIRASDGGAPHSRPRVFILAYPTSPRWQGLFQNNCILGAAKAAFTEHGHTAFGTWDSMVADKRLVRDGDGLSLAMERRRLSMCGNSVCVPLVEMIGRAIMEADRAAQNTEKAA